MGLGQKVKTFFSECGYVAYQIKGKKYRQRSKNFDLTRTPDLWVVLKRSDIEIVQVSIFFIELSTKIVDTLLIMMSMIPKVNLGVGEMGFIFCDSHISLK